MRVALDGTPLTVSSGGTRRYTLELSRALAEAFPHDAFRLVSDQPFQKLAQTTEPGAAGKWPGAGCLEGRAGPVWAVEANPPATGLDRCWWSFGLSRYLRRERIDLFHGTNFEVPLLPLRPSVLTLLDLSPWKNPAWHHQAARVRKRTPLLLRFHIPTLVLTISEAIRKEAIDYFNIPPHRIHAVPLAAADHLRPVPARPGQSPFFLYVGTLEPRKNIATAIAAWRSVNALHPIRLLLAGRQRADFQPPSPEPGLELLGEVTDAELAQLYSECTACLYPSLYEGFGLPVLEAMQCGAPVLTSRDPAITEVAAGAALQMEAQDVQSWKETMLAVLQNPELSAKLRAQSLARSREFSWQKTAQMTHHVYKEAIRRFDSR